MSTAARKTAKSKVTATSFNPSDKAIKAADAGKKSLPVKKSVAVAEANKTAGRRVGVTNAKEKAAATEKVVKVATPKGRVVAHKVVKPAAKRVAGASKALVEAMHTIATQPPLKKAVKADKQAKALDKIVKNKKVAKAKAVTFRGFVIPVNRKSTDSEDSVPTISVKNVADTIKLFEKLPKGCTWLADTSAATKDTLNLYNKSGAYIAEVRINK